VTSAPCILHSAFLIDRPARGRPAPGFTLVEVLVALTLLSGVLLVVAQLSVVAGRAGEASKETGMATTLAAQKIEQLRALAWGMAGDGAAVDDFESAVAEWPDRPSGGHGLGFSPPGTLDDNTPGYVDYLDAAGEWVGAGASPPGAAVFARRWSIEPAGPSAPSTLVLRVAVWRRAPAWAIARAGAVAWRPVVQLNSAKARRAE
jgi:prepilin-type N-terminal cleavage/methylation domain-containing protein